MSTGKEGERGSYNLSGPKSTYRWFKSETEFPVVACTGDDSAREPSFIFLKSLAAVAIKPGV